MTTNTLRIGAVELTRVGYADVDIPPERVGLTEAEVRAVDWATPTWATGGQVRAGAAAWVIESGDARIVVDPAQAADDILRSGADAKVHQEAFAALLDAAGFPRESFTHTIVTHVEGIGMLAWRNDDGSWVRFFPNAPMLISQRDLDAVDAGTLASDTFGALDQLRAQGAVTPVSADDTRIDDNVSIEHSGGHTPGHQIVRITSNGETAIMLGHLAVSAVHLGTGENPIEHVAPELAEQVLTKLRNSDAVLIGPLWPAPGAGRWDGARLVPV